MLLTYVQKRTKWKRVAENFHLFRGVCVRGKVILNGVTITLFGWTNTETAHANQVSSFWLKNY